MNFYYATALLIAAVISAAIAFTAWKRRTAPGASGLMLFKIAGAVWAATYAVRWLMVEPSAQLFWLDMTYFGAAPYATLAVIFGLQFTHRSHLLTRRNLTLLAIMPLLTLFFLWTDDWHGLFFGGRHNTGTILNGGVWFWFYILYTFVQIFVLISLYIKEFLHAAGLYRWQVGTVLFASSFPIIAIVIGLAGISPFHDLDLTPIIFSVSGLIYAYGLFGFRMLDVVPIARHKLVDEMADGVIVLDANKRIVDINPAVQRLIGISDSAIGQSAGEVLNERLQLDQAGDPKAPRLMDICVSENPPVDIELQTLPLLDQHQKLSGQLLILHEITERKQAIAALRRAQEALEAAHLKLQESFAREQQLARTDDLTGINNHRAIMQLARREIEVAVRYQQPLTMMFFDIDYFKKVNDTFGHAGGDEVLKKTVQTVCDMLRSADLIGRYGGDEFIILLPQTSAQEALPLAERIHASVADIHLNTMKGPFNLMLTLSIGIAQSIQDSSRADSVEDLLLRADQALFASKQAGRHCTMIFSDALGGN